MTKELDDTIIDDDTDDKNKDKLSLSEEHEKLIEAQVAARLTKMKKSMDKMASERDSAIREKERLAEEAREQKVKQLEEDGKIVESLEMKLTAAQEKAAILQERLDRETRDRHVSSALRGVDFRSAKAAAAAEREIVDQLVKDKDGVWVHRSGASVVDFITTFFNDEDNHYLLKPKVSKGTGGPDETLDATKPKIPKSLEGLTSQQRLEIAREKLKLQGRG
jgi:hypothetical protein